MSIIMADLTVDTRKIPEAKALIRKFRRELAALMEDGTQDEVYQLCIQLFPFSQVRSCPEEAL